MANGTGTTEDVRRSNLSATLGILYRTGPVSRAALSKRTGRNRSTIASLVTDLVDLGLVEERDPDSLGQVGRPSPVVTIRPEVTAIAVNPEIDVLTIGLVGLDGQVRRVIRHEYGHVLGFPDCYVEFYDSEAKAIINYQIDTTNLMCSRRGKLQEKHFLELQAQHTLEKIALLKVEGSRIVQLGMCVKLGGR